MIKRIALMLAVPLLILRIAGAADSTAQPALTFIKAGHLVDVAAGKIVEGSKILIEGDRIKAVGADLTPPAGATVLDLSSAWVLPGMIDCHTHITFQFGNYYDDAFRKSPIDTAVYAHVYARRTLEAGFTTCRDVGAGEFVDVALRNAINSRDVPGPRLFVAAHPISATGGHGDISGFSPYLHFDNFNGVADGVDEIRKKVRWNIKYGADVIKFTATAGVLTEEESVGAPQYSAEEMKAIVEEAAAWGRKVAAHAHGAEGIKRAVAAGVASIEHGSLVDDEGIAMMKQRGTFLVPTVYVGYAVEQDGAKWHLPQKLMDKAHTINSQKSDCLRKAIAAGVKIAYGTDAGVFPHGENAKDFRYLVELGMSPIAAMQAATIRAAELLGQTENVGAIQPGKFADIVAVGSDPSKDITVLEKVAFVMKSGQVYKNTLRAVAQP